MEKVAIHNCLTGQIEVRDRTPTEQAQVDAVRAVEAAKPQPVDELASLKARVELLESKVRP